MPVWRHTITWTNDDSSSMRLLSGLRMCYFDEYTNRVLFIPPIILTCQKYVIEMKHWYVCDILCTLCTKNAFYIFIYTLLVLVWGLKNYPYVVYISLTSTVWSKDYSEHTESIISQLIPWFLALPGHQQPWHWLCKIARLSCIRKYFNHLCHLNVLKTANIVAFLQDSQHIRGQEA